MQYIEANFYNPSRKKTSLSPIFRQTKNFKGIYKNVKYFNDNINAEWQILNTWIEDISEIKDKKIIYLQQEPPEFLLPCKEILDKCKLTISPFRFDHHIKQYITNAPLQWLYDLNIKRRNKGHEIKLANKKDLNQISNMSVPKKNKICSMIVSARTKLPGHKKRVSFTYKIKDHFKKKIDIYGFGFSHITNKKNAIDPYLYSIAIENSSYRHYWTEKISDVFLGYAAPIYYGCKNLDEYFNKDSYINLDINNIDKSIWQIENILNNPDTISIDAIIRSRKKVIKEYNLFYTLSMAIRQNTTC